MKRFYWLIIASLTYSLALFCSNESLEAEKNFLKKCIKRNPDNQLYAFDLALIFQDLKKFDKAIKLYSKSRLLDNEKGWYSEFMIGRCCELKGAWDNALEYYKSAFKRRPSRSEPLYYISQHYYDEGNHSQVCFYANKGRKISLPTSDTLYVEKDIYNYRFNEQLSVAAYYDENYKKHGAKYIDKIMFNVKVPKPVKENCFRNLLYYLENLANVQYIPIQVNTPFLNDWSTERYKPCNPSIFKTENGYIINCRAVNTVQWYPDYVVMDGTKLPKSKNVFVEYDKDLKKIFETQIIEDPSLVKYQTRHQGLEDLRIFNFKNELCFTCTTCQLNEYGIPKMCFGKFDRNSDGSVSINKITLLNGPIAERPEKNWMPLVVNDELYLIYSFAPFVIYKPNLETGECVKFIDKNPDFDFSRFLGSSPPIPFDDGYLVIVHEGIWLDRKYYLHRFVYLNKNFEVKKFSRPFTFKHKGVEMCCGMVINHEGDKLIMTMALEDREAYFALIDLETIRSLLKDLKN